MINVLGPHPLAFTRACLEKVRIDSLRTRANHENHETVAGEGGTGQRSAGCVGAAGLPDNRAGPLDPALPANDGG